LYKYVVETSDCITLGNLLAEYTVMFEGRICAMDSVVGHLGHSVDNLVSWFGKSVPICEYIDERTTRLSKDLFRKSRTCITCLCCEMHVCVRYIWVRNAATRLFGTYIRCESQLVCNLSRLGIFLIFPKSLHAPSFYSRVQLTTTKYKMYAKF
jgi:hypothetical protein